MQTFKSNKEGRKVQDYWSKFDNIDQSIEDEEILNDSDEDEKHYGNNFNDSDYD